jgi:hypothetical protein
VSTTALDPAPVASAERGVLVVTNRAAQRLVEGVIAHTAPHVTRPDVRVSSLSDEAAEFAITLKLEYPDAPLSRTLDDLRRRIAIETGRLLGRPVRRIDLTVSEFITRPSMRPRVI